jgi:hypothetical protein
MRVGWAWPTFTIVSQFNNSQKLERRAREKNCPSQSIIQDVSKLASLGTLQISRLRTALEEVSNLITIPIQRGPS